MRKIGIIGKGFVGSAVAHGFSEATGYQAEIKIFDKYTVSLLHGVHVRSPRQYLVVRYALWR